MTVFSTRRRVAVRVGCISCSTLLKSRLNVPRVCYAVPYQLTSCFLSNSQSVAEALSKHVNHEIKQLITSDMCGENRCERFYACTVLLQITDFLSLCSTLRDALNLQQPISFVSLAHSHHIGRAVICYQRDHI